MIKKGDIVVKLIRISSCETACAMIRISSRETASLHKVAAVSKKKGIRLESDDHLRYDPDTLLEIDPVIQGCSSRLVEYEGSYVDD